MSFAYLAIAGGAVAFTSYVWLLEHMSAPIVATYTFVNPVIAVVLGWIVLGERISGQMLGGMLLVIGSLAVLVWFSHKGQITDRGGELPGGQGLNRSTVVARCSSSTQKA
jgi:drug/metabolite transporter (DMT)-like permease